MVVLLNRFVQIAWVDRSIGRTRLRSNQVAHKISTTCLAGPLAFAGQRVFDALSDEGGLADLSPARLGCQQVIQMLGDFEGDCGHGTMVILFGQSGNTADRGVVVVFVGWVEATRPQRHQVSRRT